MGAEVADGRIAPAVAGRADRGDAAVSDKLPILSPASAHFPARRNNPNMQLVKRLTQLRRPALSDDELISHIFPRHLHHR